MVTIITFLAAVPELSPLLLGGMMAALASAFALWSRLRRPAVPAAPV